MIKTDPVKRLFPIVKEPDIDLNMPKQETLRVILDTISFIKNELLNIISDDCQVPLAKWEEYDSFSYHVERTRNEYKNVSITTSERYVVEPHNLRDAKIVRLLLAILVVDTGKDIEVSDSVTELENFCDVEHTEKSMQEIKDYILSLYLTALISPIKNKMDDNVKYDMYYFYTDMEEPMPKHNVVVDGYKEEVSIDPSDTSNDETPMITKWVNAISFIRKKLVL